MSASDSSIRNPKRKLEDSDHSHSTDEADFTDSCRMSKTARSGDVNAADGDGRRGRCDELVGFEFLSVSKENRVWRSCSDVTLRCIGLGGSSMLQFFAKLISGESVLIRANRKDSVLNVLEEVKRRTGVPAREMRVVFKGRQLQEEEILEECGVENDCVLQLVARMRSTEYPKVWMVLEDVGWIVNKMCHGEFCDILSIELRCQIGLLVKDILSYDYEKMRNHVRILVDSQLRADLMKLYLSGMGINMNCAQECISLVIQGSIGDRSGQGNIVFYPLVLEFGKVLSKVGYDRPEYLYCRKALAKLVKEYSAWAEVMNSVRHVLPFVFQAARKLSKDLHATLESPMNEGPLPDDVCDFSSFFELLKHVVHENSGGLGYIVTPIPDDGSGDDCTSKVIKFLYAVFGHLVAKMNSCLQVIENSISRSGKENCIQHKGWEQYLPILKVLYNISKLYLGAEHHYRAMLGFRKAAFCFLVLKYGSRVEDPFWVVEHKDLLDFKTRRHLVMMLFSENDDYDGMHEMLIDRSNLLAESFEYIGNADREALHSDLYVEFKNEVATGPGVLREWFSMVCQAIFYTGNPLFMACPNDRRRFYLNPASTVDPLHPDYLRFCGRVIGLAVRHRVQVGIVFDRVFFLQLAGLNVTLEDIRDADPELYKSCKLVLDMDAEIVDADALGLTFVREVDVLGSRKTVELCPGGGNQVVNSSNRGKYVDLLIYNRFVASTLQQMLYFSEGFGDVLEKPWQRNIFFQSLDLEDLDLLLQGSGPEISVDDWKTHTEYQGYKHTDPQIAWFWKIVEEMSVEQRRVLLFYWTSIKYLPPEGFQGLPSQLYLSRALVPQDRLPSSHTCFFQLCLPAYSSLQVMQSRLNIITQEHFSLSFGTW